jgi:hypothetical protein
VLGFRFRREAIFTRGSGHLKQLTLPFEKQGDVSRRASKPTVINCVYCGAVATTRDHTPPKVLLEKPFPSNLRTVPACRSCNAGWSLDEQYMAVVLAQVGHHPHLLEKVEPGGSIDRTLAASPCLDETVTNALKVAEDGRVWFQISRSIGSLALVRRSHSIWWQHIGCGPAFAANVGPWSKRECSVFCLLKAGWLVTRPFIVCWIFTRRYSLPFPVLRPLVEKLASACVQRHGNSIGRRSINGRWPVPSRGMVPAERIELPTFGLQNCSTTAVLRRPRRTPIFGGYSVLDRIARSLSA